MDFLYSYSLLISLITGAASIPLGIFAMLRRSPGPRLIRLGLSAVVLATISLVISVVVHRHWGHGPASVEPMDVVRFVVSHTGFLAASIVIAIGLALVLYARQLRQPPNNSFKPKPLRYST
jgi:hypothetical protein